jgi:F0F1-type ATP synthase assembly protein I
VRLSGAGFELAAGVAGFVLLGLWFDRRFGTKPWGILSGALLGIVGGSYNLIRVALLSAPNRQAGRDDGLDERQDDA